ncbi:hypothetical protein BJX66DRAFT_331068 [Aspergillus keveii]|uniref:3CxxC-type domain-containing protein n=1 Tax=Aspergillus keveii TaxID=714993 RepID=A0ABR4FHT0_9EURO
MPGKGRKAAKLWSLHPQLHDNIVHHADDEEANIQERDTNVMGGFMCQNSGCHSSGWSSKKMAIAIRMYPRQQYHARESHQRCRNCKAVGWLVLDTECYAERVQRPDYSGQSRGPHDSGLCEGCKVGHCPNSNEDLALVLAR